MGQTRKSRRAETIAVNNTKYGNNAIVLKATSPKLTSFHTNTVGKTQNKKMNHLNVETKLSFDYELPFDSDSLKRASVELLFHYLRFHVFEDIEDERKKELFTILSSVKCKEDAIFKQILAYADAHDFQGLLDLAKRKQIKLETFIESAYEDVEKLVGKEISSNLEIVPQKTVETMIDGWFLEENPYLAYALFQELLFSLGTDKDLKVFLDQYQSMPPMGRKHMVVYTRHDTFQIT
jgi:hypothetical protein